MSFYYAQINDSNIAIGTSCLSGETDAPNLVQITEAQYESAEVLGKKYDAAKKEWVKQPDPVPVVNRTLPAGAFRLRFNFNERTKVELASVIDPTASAADQKTQATVKTFYADLNSQRYINLDSESVLRGCNLLDTLGILDTGWKARIIDANPTAEELRFPG
jgi:hypothetical protein